MTTHAPRLPLTGGTTIPQLALGTWPLDDAEAEKAVRSALDLGYRHVDTAENYRNERGVGAAVRAGGLPREDVFVTTKINKEWHTDPRAGVRGNLERLGLEYVDLVLIHWPNPDQDEYARAWEGLVALREEGVVRAIGTSNFLPEHVDRLVDATGVAPEVNQIELYPGHDQPEQRAYAATHGTLVEAWSPLGRASAGLMEHPTVTAIAERHERTPAQVVLRWEVQQGLLAAPKSATPERQAANLDVFDFALTQDEMAEVTAVPDSSEKHLDPRTFGH